jgi:hypothetical protein
MMHNSETMNGATPEEIAEFAVKVADATIEKLYFPPYHKEEVK